MSLGRLENFNLGMGLAANRDETIHSRHAAFDGFDDNPLPPLAKKAVLVAGLAFLLFLISRGSK